MKKSVSYRKNLLDDLKHPLEAEAYLNAAIEAGDRTAFLLALRNVLDAQASMSEIARKTKIHRISLHKMLARNGNPTTESLLALFRILGIRLRLHTRKNYFKQLDKAA